MTIRELRPRRLHLALGLLAALGLTGCIETKVAVQLQKDGSGTRLVEMVWEVDALEDLNLSDDDVRLLLGLAPERGWTLRREDRPNQGGNLEPHVVFTREARLADLDAWAREAPDLNLGVGRTVAARMHDEVSVEIGLGPGYRTLRYHEVLDGRAIRDLLDRVAADHLIDLVAQRRTDLSSSTRAELRGLLVGHLGHREIWVLDDDDVDAAQEALLQDVAPQFTWILEGGDPSPTDLDTTRAMLREIFATDDGDLGGKLESDLPGLALISFMNLKFEIVVPGTIVESNANRVGDGYAAWEGPIWSAINAPWEFRLRSIVEE